MELLDIDPYITETIKKNVTYEYREHIKKRVLKVKEEAIKRMAKRRDVQQMLIVQDKNARTDDQGGPGPKEEKAYNSEEEDIEF